MNNSQLFAVSRDKELARQQTETTVEFWDCDCTYNYIKPSSQPHCNLCGCDREDCPDSRVNEVQAYQAETEYAQLGFLEPIDR